jgi:hypothetical protein
MSGSPALSATPAGTFRNCWVVETWASANANDAAWVGEGTARG